MQNVTLIRFVTDNRHPPYGHRSGLFQVASKLWREHALTEPEHTEIRSLLDWFNEHLLRRQNDLRPRGDPTRRVQGYRGCALLRINT